MSGKVTPFRGAFSHGHTTEAPKFEGRAYSTSRATRPVGASDLVYLHGDIAVGNTFHRASRSYGTPDTDNAVRALVEEVSELKSEIHRLAAAVTVLARSLGPDESVLRELSLSEARSEIVAFLKEHGESYPSEIAQALGIDYDLVAEVLEALRTEGAAAPTRPARG